jgi:hypothetical protein
MINREQFLLLKLAEECAEVAQRASKSIRFGHDEVQDGQPLTNAERLRNELADLLTTMCMIGEETDHIAHFERGEGVAYAESTRVKINRFYEYSVYLGRIE